MDHKIIHNCHLKGTPCVKFCESENEKHRCGINQRDKGKNMKTLTKAEFRELSMPKPFINERGKPDVHSARLELHPDNTGIINGNKYTINVYPYEDKVEMVKIV